MNWHRSRFKEQESILGFRRIRCENSSGSSSFSSRSLRAKRRRKPACTASFPSYDGASVSSVSFFRYRLISTLRFASLCFGFISISLWQTDWLDIRCSVEKPAHTGRISVRYALALLPHCSRLSFLSFSLAHSALTFQLFSVLGRWVGDQFLVGCFLATFQTPCFDSLSLISLTSCLRFQRQGNRCFRSLA